MGTLDKMEKWYREDPQGFLTTWALTIVIFGVTGLLPAAFFLVLSKILGAFGLLCAGLSIAFGLFCLGVFWNRYVEQNPEFTNTIIRNPDGTERVVTAPGPIFKRPGAVSEGNRVDRTTRSTTFSFKVNKNKTSLIVKGNLRYFASDGSKIQDPEVRKEALNAQNQLGNQFSGILESAIKGYLEKIADKIAPDYKDLWDLLNKRGEFVTKIEEVFREEFEVKLEHAYGIEILDDAKKGIDIALEVPDRVEKMLEKINEGELQAQAVVEATAKLLQPIIDSGREPTPEERIEAQSLAAGIVSGNVQVIAGKGAKSTASFLNVGGNNGGQ